MPRQPNKNIPVQEHEVQHLWAALSYLNCLNAQTGGEVCPSLVKTEGTVTCLRSET